ncbi:DoxX family protein [Maliponia aquimaris]|uniref:Inner membrane protein YqjF n=1 Tax=Maliponia aquimaris TaxID=1673631 RepID=A0A238KSC6_9RHOB|nr:DoxX family protein [Maliponia aquimaris]SMX44936.1 Inner membrane protein YqjF [Maliponia aquimaris]
MSPTLTTNAGLLAARILLGVLFVLAGFGKLGDVQGFAGYMASGGVPAFLAWPVVLFEIVGGLALIVGFQTRIAALALGLFALVSGVLYHYVPGDQMQFTMLLKNIALTGGYLALALAGPGAWSLDRLTGRAALQTA